MVIASKMEMAIVPFPNRVQTMPFSDTFHLKFISKFDNFQKLFLESVMRKLAQKS